jgi:hypothetical protein
MSRRTRRFALLAAGIAVIVVAGLTATFALSAHRSSQAAASTLYVGATAGANTSCASPGYTTVQSAVSAAGSRDTVYLCASGSPYTENVIVANKSLTLTGDTGATIAAPKTFNDFALPSQFASDGLLNPEAVLLVWGASANVAINGLTISGPFNNTIAGCGSQTYGVLVLSGATVALNGDNVTNISDPVSSILLGCQHGVAIQIGREYWPTPSFSFLVENFAGHASISGTTVAGYQKNGITVDGPGSSADVRGNTVNGSGRDTKYAPAIAQNGIQISRGASAQVRDNTVTGNSYTGPSFASSAGILLFGGCGDPLVTGVQVMGNTLINNDIGVAMLNYAADCVNPAGSMTNDKTIHNTISNDAVTNVGSGAVCCGFPYSGYQAGIEDVGNNDKLINNDISGAGYAAQTTVGGPFVLPIDTTSSPTTNPKVHANK